MSDLENNNGWNEWSKYVLKELEKLGDICDSLSEELNKLNIELTKISGVKHAVHDIKEWKTAVEETVNVKDLNTIKEFYLNNREIKNSIDSIKDILKEHKGHIEDFKNFKTKAYVIIGVVSFLFATALSLVKIFL